MNRTVGICVLCAVFASGLATAGESASIPALTNGVAGRMAERPSKGRMRPDAHSKPSGGMVEKAYAGNVIRIIDAQDVVSHDKVALLVRNMRWATQLPFEVKVEPALGSIESASAMARERANTPRVGASAVIVCDQDSEVGIYSAEGNWAVLNLAYLLTDKPSSATIENRFEKMLWKLAARVLHVGSPGHTPSVLAPFNSLAELDANFFMRPNPEGHNALLDGAKKYGITVLTMASYRTACHNGWAPPPTNEVQRAIWDEVKAKDLSQ